VRLGSASLATEGDLVRRAKRFALIGVLALVVTSCTYYDAAIRARDHGDPKPWWCKPTEEIPVTAGPAAGSVDWYAGTHKAALSWKQCINLSAQFDAAKAFAEQWPTAGAAEADGWNEVTGFVPGMGTHHVRGGLTAAMIADPSFDRMNPILDNVVLDDRFQPAKPEVLQFDSGSADGKLVGFDYYVRTTTGLPPAGFPGNNDWWHHHPWICHRTSDAAMIAFNVSDASCAASNGVNVNMSNYYMLHVWVLDDMTYEPDVYAGMIPCIMSPGAGTIHDPDDPCHTSRNGMAHMDHSMQPGG
jgi:hypothetical protein